MLALAEQTVTAKTAPDFRLAEIERLDAQLKRRFAAQLLVDAALSRALVSFQANKNRVAYRWYKYKEAFSASLVEFLLRRYSVERGTILDPFAGSGTALFAASELGLDAQGIELLPVGRQLIETRKLLHELTPTDFARLRHWAAAQPWQQAEMSDPIAELRITKGAYPEATLTHIRRFLRALEQESEQLRQVLFFALLCVLESVSFTRKDGQYLRWDDRSGRRVGKKPCHKGPILDFAPAISAKIAEIVADAEHGAPQTELFPLETVVKGTVRLREGSCLDILPRLPANFYDAVLTSPPYCNRYDYTRTYALELALLGVSERELAELRQQMLSCTVENRAKDLQQMNPDWQTALAATDKQELLQHILRYLDEQKAHGALNNNGIPRMVRGYFYEMACVIAECARVLRSGAPLLMVNDNVRYAGASVSVDLILSDLAQQLGFAVENILVLPDGKGNSSQQMGAWGRESLRKCVYVWRKR